MYFDPRFKGLTFKQIVPDDAARSSLVNAIKMYIRYTVCADDAGFLYVVNKALEARGERQRVANPPEIGQWSCAQFQSPSGRNSNPSDPPPLSPICWGGTKWMRLRISCRTMVAV